MSGQACFSGVLAAKRVRVRRLLPAVGGPSAPRLRATGAAAWLGLSVRAAEGCGACIPAQSLSVSLSVSAPGDSSADSSPCASVPGSRLRSLKPACSRVKEGGLQRQHWRQSEQCNPLTTMPWQSTHPELDREAAMASSASLRHWLGCVQAIPALSG